MPGARSISRVPANRVVVVKRIHPSRSRPRGWSDILWRVLYGISSNRVLSTSGGVAFFALLAAFPAIAAIVSLYGLFADASTIGRHLSLLSGFLPGGVLQLIADQITLISRQGNETLGTAFVVSLLIAVGSANSGMAALFDALNVVYDEEEKRSLVRFYATTVLFTLAGIIFVIVAIAGIVVLPLVLRLVGLAATTEWLIAILRWPVLLATIVVSLACIYRYGPSRKDARWRWVTWGRGSTAVNRFLFCGPQGYPLRKQQPRPNAKPIGSEPMRSPRHRPRRGRDGRTLVPSRRRARLAA